MVDITPLFGKPGFAMPMMRGFACPVSPPQMGGRGAPSNGMGVGWSNVPGHGIMFFLSVHGGDGMILAAQMDYARYVRLCQNLAAIGRQAMLTEKVDTQPNDPLAALGVAYDALEKARNQFSFYEREHRKKMNKQTDPDERSKSHTKAATNRDYAREMDEALRQVGNALGLIQPKEGEDAAP